MCISISNIGSMVTTFYCIGPNTKSLQDANEVTCDSIAVGLYLILYFGLISIVYLSYVDVNHIVNHGVCVKCNIFLNIKSLCVNGHFEQASDSPIIVLVSQSEAILQTRILYEPPVNFWRV